MRRLKQRAHVRQPVAAPPIEYGLGYGTLTLTNPKTDPNPSPESNNNVCSTKRHQNKVQHSVIYIYNIFS